MQCNIMFNTILWYNELTHGVKQRQSASYYLLFGNALGIADTSHMIHIVQRPLWCSQSSTSFVVTVCEILIVV